MEGVDNLVLENFYEGSDRDLQDVVIVHFWVFFLGEDVHDECSIYLGLESCELLGFGIVEKFTLLEDEEENLLFSGFEFLEVKIGDTVLPGVAGNLFRDENVAGFEEIRA